MERWRAWPSPSSGGGCSGGGGSRPPRNSWIPLPHPQSTVPPWEKKFCSDGCMIPWKLLCKNQKFAGAYRNVIEWDDSAALEAFQNAKTRFWAQYHGFACDIPLPDPEMYIDEVDPDLATDLEGRNSLPRFGDAVSRISGWDDAENTIADNTCGDWQLVNWDVYAEQPNHAASWGDRTVPNSCWDVKNDSSDAWNTGGSGCDAGVRQDASCGISRNYYGNNNAGNWLSEPILVYSWNSRRNKHRLMQDASRNSRRNKYTGNYTGGWGSGATENDTWFKGRNNSDNHGVNHGHGCDEAAKQDDLYRTRRINHVDSGRGLCVPWENSSHESGRSYGRKRNGGGWADSRANKMRYQNRVH